MLGNIIAVPFVYSSDLRILVQNENFGALRVLNDDLVKGRAGFGCASVTSYKFSGLVQLKGRSRFSA